MNDLNSVTLIGRLTADPETKQVSNGNTMTEIRIANNRTYQKNGEKTEDVNFFTVICWGKRGEAVSKFLSKGKRIAVEGRLSQHNYETPAGDKINIIRVVAKDIEFLDSFKVKTDDAVQTDKPNSKNRKRAKDAGVESGIAVDPGDVENSEMPL